MSVKENVKGCSSAIIYLFGLGFICIVAETLIGLLFGGSSFISNFLDPESGGTSLRLLRFTFWTLVAAFVVFFIAGGNIEDIFGKKKSKLP